MNYKEIMGLPQSTPLSDLDAEFCAAWIGGQFDDRTKGETT